MDNQCILLTRLQVAAHPVMPTLSILLSLTPGDFTHQGESAATE